MHYMIGDGRAPGAPRAHDRLHRYRRVPHREADRLALSPQLLRAALQADVVHVNHYGAVTSHALGVLGRLTGTPSSSPTTGPTPWRSAAASACTDCSTASSRSRSSRPPTVRPPAPA